MLASDGGFLFASYLFSLSLIFCWSFNLFRLISASVATVVHYGFHCHPGTSHGFLGLCFATGVAGNIFPFVKWFNQFEYRVSIALVLVFRITHYVNNVACLDVPHCVLPRARIRGHRSHYCDVHAVLHARSNILHMYVYVLRQFTPLDLSRV